MQNRTTKFCYSVILSLAAICCHHSQAVAFPATPTSEQIPCSCSFPKKMHHAKINGQNKPDRKDANGNVVGYFCFAEMNTACDCNFNTGECYKQESVTPCECGKPLEIRSVVRCERTFSEECGMRNTCNPIVRTVELECKEYEVVESQFVEHDLDCTRRNRQCENGKCKIRFNAAATGAKAGEFLALHIDGTCGGDEIDGDLESSYMDEYLQDYYLYKESISGQLESPTNSGSANSAADEGAEKHPVAAIQRMTVE